MATDGTTTEVDVNICIKDLTSQRVKLLFILFAPGTRGMGVKRMASNFT